MSLADAFELVRAALQAADIRYAVGGSWASLATLDRGYLDRAASEFGIRDRLQRALGEA